MSVRVQQRPQTTRQGRWPDGFSHPAAWVLCAAAALLGALIYQWEPLLPVLLGASSRQAGIWLTMALLLGLWMIPSLPRIFSILLALLAMRLFDLASTALLLTGAVSDVALWWLGSFAVCVAAQQCGLLGVLWAYALRSLQTPGVQGLRPPAVLWLTMVFSLLPSPMQASRWTRSFCLAPWCASPAVSRDVVSAAQLAARLAWLPAHPVNLMLLALLPMGGLDRFVPAHWVLSTWPLLLLALVYATYAQWRAPLAPDFAPPVPELVPVPQEDRFAMQCTGAIAVVLVLMVALQPFHGFAPGLVSLLAMVALFALKILPPQSYHRGVDWQLFVIATVLPGLIASFAAALPAWSLDAGGTFLALPFLFFLRMVLPPGVTIVAALVLAVSWSSTHGHDLLNTALSVLVAFHLVDFMFCRNTAGSAVTRWQLAWNTLRRPVTWGTCAAYYAWAGWYGW